MTDGNAFGANYQINVNSTVHASPARSQQLNDAATERALDHFNPAH